MILVDGREADGIPADDRGLAYGDGVFETMRAMHGTIPLLDLHLERLQRGLAALGIVAPPSASLTGELGRAAGEVRDGVVKLIVTRGSGGRGYMPGAHQPRRVVLTGALPADLPRWREEGMHVAICTTPLDGPAALAGLKHLNRLPQVLASREFPGRADEGLMRDAQDYVVEGTRTNLFVVAGGQLVTPPAGRGVAGVMRRLVMTLAAAEGLTVREAPLRDADLGGEMFLVNAVLGVCPVAALEDAPRPIGTMTRRLQAAVDQEMERRAC